nr:ribokinase [Corynebacterium lactis]
MDIAASLRELAAAAPEVCVVGSINADLTVTVERLPHGGQTVAGSPLRILPGGKSANQAATAGRLGASTRLIGAVGSDPNGSLLLDALTSAGVDVSDVARTESSTGTAMIVVDDSAENFIVISAGANGDVDEEMVRRHRDRIESARVLGLCLEIKDESVIAAARIANGAGVPVVFNLSPIREVSEELLGLVDVLIVNEHELAAIVGEEAAREGFDGGNWERAGRALADGYGISDAVVTLGGAGSVVLGMGERGDVSATPIALSRSTSWTRLAAVTPT